MVSSLLFSLFYGPVSPSDHILSMTMAFCYFQSAIQKKSSANVYFQDCDLFNPLVSHKVRVVNITTKVPRVPTLFLGKKFCYGDSFFLATCCMKFTGVTSCAMNKARTKMSALFLCPYYNIF